MHEAGRAYLPAAASRDDIFVKVVFNRESREFTTVGHTRGFS
jgi:hypothetical protein